MKNKFNKFKPLKEMKISGKPVQVFNDNPIPKKSVIKNVYDKMPDNTNIPLQFMTRKQYMNKYIKNQEKINNVDFPISQEKKFIKNRTPHYSNIIGRYTTNNNPYYPQAVVVFNDKNNQKNIKGDNFRKLAWHEYGHELAEKENINLPLQKEERFADNVSEFAKRNEIYSDKKAKNYALSNIKKDKVSKNDKVFFPRKLKEQGVSFDKSVSPRKKRILTKTLRKNPDLLKKKGSSKVELGVHSNKSAFGTTEPVTEKEGDKTYFKTGEYKVGFNEGIFNKKYDPNFVSYVSEKRDVYEPSEEYLEEERKHLPRIQKLHSSRHDIPRSMTHEFEHVKQIEGFGGNIAEFKESYDRDTVLYGYEGNKYESEAREAAEEQTEKRMDRSITEGDLQDVWFYKEPEEISDKEWEEMTTRKEPEPDNYSENKQVLWRAGNEPPSENLEKEGRVFGFSSIDYAKGWKESKGYSNIYSFATDDYEIDEKRYVRPLEGKKKTMSDNEYVAKNVISEQKIE